jgi:hypothetical protein
LICSKCYNIIYGTGQTAERQEGAIMGNHKSRKRIMAWLLVLCLILSLAISALFVTTHAKHHCTGRNCAVCEQINYCFSQMEHLGGNEAAVKSSLHIMMAFIYFAIVWASFLTCPISLTQLKIRLNN